MSEETKYRSMYFTLFNQITDALAALDARNYGQAEEILRTAQQRAEDTYLQETESR